VCVVNAQNGCDVRKGAGLKGNCEGRGSRPGPAHKELLREATIKRLQKVKRECRQVGTRVSGCRSRFQGFFIVCLFVAGRILEAGMLD